ncbi:tetracycline resistance MFS efflux pump [Roseiflexus castenholzii]|jgi:MFS family permease|uniref:Major facilitator superfamily MFS_1 n=1 Tax=Roseiflexus castenholzii (strain DSM 13941 / HLO8) TaxID=383372 RepID=A7NHJ9_ROSCS|nr:tetracycline resistance MFS efflux pump [Roseiflexus castenholzii]ABU56946.1 major facilitator superfamily MFS_1 [Roseiflexus castenholzii DSM 13941]
MTSRSPRLFIFLTVLIDLLGVGIVLPLMPYYVKIVEQSSIPWLAANRAMIVGALMASFALMQFLFAPVLGALSDRYGRRPILLLSLVGSALSYTLFGMAEYLSFLGVETVLAILFLGRILSGITGASISTAQAYIADVTTPEERAKGMGMIGAAFGLGFMLGPALGGLLSTVNLALPAFVAAGLALANVGFGYFNLPESLPRERRTVTSVRGVNPLERVSALLRRASIRPLLIGVLMLNLAFASLQSNFAVFSDVRFGFGPLDNALIFTLVGLLAVLMQGVLIRRLVLAFGEARLVIAGMALMSLGFVAIAVVPQAWMLFPVIGVVAIGSGMATPSLTSLISRRVAAHEQGMTLGGTQALTSLAMIIGPIFAGVTFDSIGAGAPYYLGGILIAAAITVVGSALLPMIRQRVEQPQGSLVVGRMETE